MSDAGRPSFQNPLKGKYPKVRWGLPRKEEMAIRAKTQREIIQYYYPLTARQAKEGEK